MRSLIPERDWQQTVIETAECFNWLCYHTFDARRSEPGFPDLCLVKDGRVIFAELKTAKGRLSPAQIAWGERLRACPGVSYFVWRPADFDAAVEILRAPVAARKVEG